MDLPILKKLDFQRVKCYVGCHMGNLDVVFRGVFGWAKFHNSVCLNQVASTTISIVLTEYNESAFGKRLVLSWHPTESFQVEPFCASVDISSSQVQLEEEPVVVSDFGASEIEVEDVECFDRFPLAASKNQRKIKEVVGIVKRQRGRPRKLSKKPLVDPVAGEPRCLVLGAG